MTRPPEAKQQDAQRTRQHLVSLRSAPKAPPARRAVAPQCCCVILEPPADLATIGLDAPVADIEIGKSREDGDGGAIVPTSFTVGGQTYELDVTMQQDDGGYLVTNDIPVPYVMHIGTELENAPSSWLANGTDIGLQPVYRVPYGEFVFEPADSGRYVEAPPIPEGTRVVVDMVPGFENIRDAENAQELIDEGYPGRIE